MKHYLALLTVATLALPAWAAPVSVDFEAPTYALGSLDGQSGGGIAWTEFEPDADASVAKPGFNSVQAARWEAKDLGTDSDGDDMLGVFDNGQAAVFSLSAMTYVHLEANRPNGTSRSGHIFVSDSGFNGSALTFLDNGNVGYWGGGGFFIWDTGTPIIYDAWVPIELQLDYTNDQVTVFYNNVQVAQNQLTGLGQGYADQLDIWLDTVALEDNPSPSDWMAIDDIVITPEPATLSLLLLGALGLLRRR